MEKVTWLVQGTCWDALSNPKGPSTVPSSNLQSIAGDSRTQPSYEAPETTLQSSSGGRGMHAGHSRCRKAQRRIKITLPKPVGAGRGNVTTAGAEVHQAGAIKLGGEKWL